MYDVTNLTRYNHSLSNQGRVSEKLEDLETRLEAKEEAREKAILDLKKENFNLCEEIRFDDEIEAHPIEVDLMGWLLVIIDTVLGYL